LSLEKLFILAVVALFVLGPQRLPMAASWLAKTIRRIKDFANDANGKLRSDLGPEFDEIREPLRGLHTEWTELRHRGARPWRARSLPLTRLDRIETTPTADPGGVGSCATWSTPAICSRT
jgi:Tat protein translocase TatB subunit